MYRVSLIHMNDIIACRCVRAGRHIVTGRVVPVNIKRCSVDFPREDRHVVATCILSDGRILANIEECEMVKGIERVARYKRVLRKGQWDVIQRHR